MSFHITVTNRRATAARPARKMYSRVRAENALPFAASSGGGGRRRTGVRGRVDVEACSQAAGGGLAGVGSPGTSAVVGSM